MNTDMRATVSTPISVRPMCDTTFTRPTIRNIASTMFAMGTAAKWCTLYIIGDRPENIWS